MAYEEEYSDEYCEGAMEYDLRCAIGEYMKYWHMTSAQMKRYCNNIIEDVIDSYVAQCVRDNRPIPQEWRIS